MSSFLTPDQEALLGVPTEFAEMVLDLSGGDHETEAIPQRVADLLELSDQAKASQSANRLLALRGHLMREHLAQVAPFEIEHARLDGEIRAMTTAHEKKLGFIETQLELFHRARFSEDEKASIKLPSGTLTSTKKQNKVTVSDADAFEAWVLAQETAPDWVTVDETVVVKLKAVPARQAFDAGQIKAQVLDTDEAAVLVTEDGEQLPFLKVEEPDVLDRNYKIK